MKFQRVCRGVVLGFCVLLCASVAIGATDIRQEVKAKCSRCHSTKRICLNLGIKDRAAWHSTIQSMVNKGAQLTPAKVDAAVDYLTGEKPGSGPLCQ